MPALKEQIWKEIYRTRIEKPPESEKQQTFCHSIYTFYRSLVSFPYKQSTCSRVTIKAGQINRNTKIAADCLNLNFIGNSGENKTKKKY